MSSREQVRISRRLRSPTYPKRCAHHALFSDRCILCLKARIRELTERLDRIATGDFDDDVAGFAARAFVKGER